jgi:hypothetical protein
VLNLRLTQLIWFTLFLCHDSTGIQDLSCTSAAQDKSCTPEALAQDKSCTPEPSMQEQVCNQFAFEVLIDPQTLIFS